MKTSDISINGNRVTVPSSDNLIQFVVWNLESKQHEDFSTQLTTAFSLCSTFDEIERHMVNNGYDMNLEDIYPN